MTGSEEAEAITRHARQERARVREQIATAHERLGETQHATEDVMHRVADKLPDPAHVHERARELSERADAHLHRAAWERAVANRGEDD